MTRPSRRTLLGSTATLIGLSAGCIADDTGSPAGDDDDRSDADEGSPSADGAESNPESTDGESEDLPDGLTDYETLAYRYGAASPESTMTVLRTADAVTGWLDDRESLPDSAAIDDFVDETDFETSILVSVEGDAPNPCYELVLESIGIEESDDGEGEDDEGSDDSEGEDDEEGLVLEGAVRDTSAEDEACVQSLATVGRLVRATFESEPLTTVSASVDGHGGSSTGASSGSDSATEPAGDDPESGSGNGQSGDGS